MASQGAVNQRPRAPRLLRRDANGEREESGRTFLGSLPCSESQSKRRMTSVAHSYSFAMSARNRVRQPPLENFRDTRLKQSTNAFAAAGERKGQSRVWEIPRAATAGGVADSFRKTKKKQRNADTVTTHI